MPLGWERINAKTSGPNKNIVFIKALLGPDEKTSKDFLERIAAQCLPIMNKHHLAVASLEEYEPNPEFWGRNFNHGEVIQLVLKSPSTGRWLPFKFVQAVMMHELAHCKQMNHSKAFWAVKNEFTSEMHVLWKKEYTGDGLWGKGVLLENGAFSHEQLGEGEEFPEHMCGGSFVSRGNRKRKIKPQITYKEQKERRIRKKFGTSGVVLGAEVETKAKLEKGRRPSGKPRVAGSARGRELRAAAALSRIEVTKEEPNIKDEDLVTDSEAESASENHVIIKTERDDAVGIHGEKLLDLQGNHMVKVCEDYDQEKKDAKQEMRELQLFAGSLHWSKLASFPALRDAPQATVSPISRESQSSKPKKVPQSASAVQKSIRSRTREKISRNRSIISTRDGLSKGPARAEEADASTVNEDGQENLIAGVENGCPICSVENESTALTCAICSNVLQPKYVANTWICKSAVCQDSKFINAGDVGLCGVCGDRKCSGGTGMAAQ